MNLNSGQKWEQVSPQMSYCSFEALNHSYFLFIVTSVTETFIFCPTKGSLSVNCFCHRKKKKRRSLVGNHSHMAPSTLVNQVDVEFWPASLLFVIKNPQLTWIHLKANCCLAELNALFKLLTSHSVDMEMLVNQMVFWVASSSWEWRRESGIDLLTITRCTRSSSRSFRFACRPWWKCLSVILVCVFVFFFADGFHMYESMWDD